MKYCSDRSQFCGFQRRSEDTRTDGQIKHRGGRVDGAGARGDNGSAAHGPARHERLQRGLRA